MCLFALFMLLHETVSCMLLHSLGTIGTDVLWPELVLPFETAQVS